jgi:dihydrodipicolinate synthase/N-acetylneuraminate lyase
VQATCELIKRVADSRLRIVLYHIPSVTGVAFTEVAVAEIIRQYPQQIIGLKDSSGDQQHSLRFIKRFPSIGIVIGNELQIPKLVPEGATGSVCGAGNISPNLVLRIIRNPQNVDKTDWAALNALGGLVWDAGKPQTLFAQHFSHFFPIFFDFFFWAQVHRSSSAFTRPSWRSRRRTPRGSIAACPRRR